MGQDRADAVLAYIGIGANLGDPGAMFERVCNRRAFIPQNAIFDECGINRGLDLYVLPMFEHSCFANA